MTTVDHSSSEIRVHSGDDLSRGLAFASLAALLLAGVVCDWLRAIGASPDASGEIGAKAAAASVVLADAARDVHRLTREVCGAPSTRSSRNRLLRALAVLQDAIEQSAREVTS